MLTKEKLAVWCFKMSLMVMGSLVQKFYSRKFLLLKISNSSKSSIIEKF